MADKTFLSWPFFTDRHRALAASLEQWCAANLPADHGDVDAACRDLVQKLGRDGWLAHTAPDPDSPAALDVRTLCLIRETLAPDLQAAIDALPEWFRQAVWLRDVEEFSYAEIADMLSVPVGTVMSRISRGRRMLFERLNHPRPVNA